MNAPARYVFVAGLHRTGTSLLARLAAMHPALSAIENAPVPEGEGAYLQGAIPHTALDGVPGHYATDPAQHLVEGCAYDTLAVRDRLTADWEPWFDDTAKWRLEKSPVNLVRMRLYQQLFPTAQFIVILRHPEAMAAALAKWTDRSHGALIRYALDAYASMTRDLPYLHCAIVIRYEDLIAHPAAHMAAVDRFLSLAPHDRSTAFEALRDGNRDYSGCGAMTARQADRAAALGYGRHLSVDPFEPVLRHPLREVRQFVAAALRNI